MFLFKHLVKMLVDRNKIAILTRISPPFSAGTNSKMQIGTIKTPTILAYILLIPKCYLAYLYLLPNETLYSHGIKPKI